MPGSPLIRALAAFIVLLELGWPLRRLTQGTEAPAPTPPPPAAASPTKVKLQITFSTPPRQFTVRHLGRELWSDRAGRTTAEQTLQLAMPKEGIELQFTAEFPGDAPLAAARLIFTDPQGDEHEKSCWGRGQIDEVVAFP